MGLFTILDGQINYVYGEIIQSFMAMVINFIYSWSAIHLNGDNLVGGYAYPSEKYENQFGLWHSSYVKRCKMFQITNQRWVSGDWSKFYVACVKIFLWIHMGLYTDYLLIIF